MRAFWMALVVTVVVAAAASASPSTPLDDIAVSRRTAERLGVRVGDVIEVSRDPGMAQSRRVRVAVILDAPEHPADVARGDLDVRFHLPVLESLLDRRDAVDRVVVRLRDPSQAVAVRDALRALGSGVDVYTADELARISSRTFVVVSRFHRAIALIAVVASAIFLVTIMTLKLTEMRREIGALRVLGIGRGTIGLTIVGVSAAVAVMGSIVGVGLGAVLVWTINAYYQPLFGTRLRFAVIVPETLLAAAGIAITVGLAAGIVVAQRLLHRRALDQVGR
ncbi:MAG TPA: ABC transporter permease [bacterium]|nr:ABC transporter permease [bacterium]